MSIYTNQLQITLLALLLQASFFVRNWTTLRLLLWLWLFLYWNWRFFPCFLINEPLHVYIPSIL
jgi:hypothetical protein